MRESVQQKKDGRVVTVYDFTDEAPEPENVEEGVVVQFKPRWVKK